MNLVRLMLGMNPLTNSKSILIAEVSDVHLGHPNTPTTHILRSLRNIFPDTETTAKLDLIIIAGDLFDRLLDYNSDDVTDIELWWIGFVKMCAREKIILRVLRGTPLHDRDQIERLFALIRGIDVDIDAVYFSELAIERIEALGLDVLYIPDEWRHRCDDTWLEVVELMKQRNLEQVDIVVMHGAFHHQMPKNIHHQLELHTAERYIKITRRVVYVGHIHQMSIYENIILAAGSTDRLCHGDEAGKGHWRSVLHPDGTQTHTFIPNPLAMRYVTVQASDINADELYTILDKKVGKLPEGSHVRLVGKKGDVALQAIDTLKVRFPTFHWSTKESKGDKETDAPLILENKPTFNTIHITSKNIEELLMVRINGKYAEAVVTNAAKLLKEVVNG